MDELSLYKNKKETVQKTLICVQCEL